VLTLVMGTHCAQRRAAGQGEREEQDDAPAICRARVKLPNSERLCVSIMAFSSGLLLMLLLPRVRLAS